MLPILIPIVSTLLTNGLNLLGNAVLAKGQDVIEQKLGVKLEDATQTPEGLLKLKQLETEHEEFLINAAIENRKIDLQAFAQEDANTDSARKMNTQIELSSEASYISKVLPYWLDAGVFVLTFGLIYLLFFVGVADKNEKLLYMALGAALTWCGTILNFHRGSSSRSQAKDDTISTLAGAK